MKVFLLTGLAVLLALQLSAQAPDYPSAPPAGNLVNAEYFFDLDPGAGNGTALALPLGPEQDNFFAALSLNGSALTNGFHRLYIRTRDQHGNWSHTSNAFFDNVVLVAYPTAPAPGADLVAAEYFFDTDPGQGNATGITLSPSQEVTSIIPVTLDNLPPGVHRFYLRTKDASGKWSLTSYGVFDNTATLPYPTAPAPAQALTAAEYFFDTDPGFGNGTAITLPSETNIPNFSFEVPVEGLGQGRHTLYLRSREIPWSLTAYAELMIGSTLPVSWLFAKAEVRQSDAWISWATGYEQNADRFIIEYSKDGVRFQAAGEVAAKNLSSGSSYGFRHTRPGAGTLYYRIKQVDLNGNYTYSQTLLLVIREGMREPVVFPNPAVTNLQVVLPSGSHYNELELYSMDGRRLKRLRLNGNEQSVTLAVQDLPKGTYQLRITNQQQTSVLPFIKQ
jgi:hypothetical protein